MSRGSKAWAARSAATGLVIVASVAAILCGLKVAPAAAIDNGSLGIRPAAESDFFHLSVLPGERLNASAIVSNHTAVSVELLTYAVDGLTTPAGIFSLGSEGQPSTGIGLWAALDTTIISVPARGNVTVPFVLTVPAGTKPGDYTGGLIVQSKPVEGVSSNSSGSPVRIDVIQRQGVRIYLTVPGVTTLGLTAQELTWRTIGDAVVLSLRVTNTGNSTLRPTARATIIQWFGSRSVVDFVSPESVPPGASVAISARLPHADLAQLAAVTAEVKSAAGTLTRSTNIISVPPLLIFATLVGLGVLVFVVWRGTRFVRRARRAFAELGRSGSVRDGHASP